MKTLYIIGGSMGVGKTTVCQQLKRELQNSVFLDGDWCWDANPYLLTAETKVMVMDNICYLLNNFLKCSVYDHIIFCWVMREQRIIDSIIEQLDTKNCIVHCISLIANETTLENRLSNDVQRGIRSADVIRKSIAKIPLYQTLKTVKIHTDNKTVAAIVREIKQL